MNVAMNFSSIFVRLLVLPVCLFMIPAMSVLSFNEAQAQTQNHIQRISFDLEEIGKLIPDTPLDTIRPPLDELTLGEYYKVPNFLTTDFDRKRKVVEYSLYAPLKVTFEHPRYYRFEFEEVRDGAFIVMTPRDLTAPGLSIEIESVDRIAERVRQESLSAMWRETVIASISRQQLARGGKKGLLNISIPMHLPGAVEKIIGSGEATNIDISGRQSITFAGESRRVNPFIGSEGQTKQPLFPSLDLRQELDVRLNGQIGEKVNIQVDHSNSSGAIQQDNRIRLSYTGFEDDIIQLIEMGNTSLSLPGSQLVSFSGRSQGLFGIKMLAQIGPNRLTVIASKEEGELSQATFTPRGGQIGQTEVRTINDADYIKNTYFYLDEPDFGAIPRVFFRPKVDSIEVFESVEPYEIAQDPTLAVWYGRAWVDTLGNGDDIRTALAMIEAGVTPPPSQDRQFRRLVGGDDYRFVRDINSNLVIGLELVRPVSNSRVLAVRYVNEFSDVIGNYDDYTDTLALELIKPFEPTPEDADFGHTWSYMMRNIYSLQLSNIDLSTLSIEIRDLGNRLDRSIPEESTIPWLRIFGLDQTDLTGTGSPDTRVDITEGLIDENRGLLTFPILRPFDPADTTVARWTGDGFEFSGIHQDFRRPEIYDKFIDDIVSAPKFQIVVTASSTSRTFSLNAFNISPGSETVRLDGRELVRNRDYSIDYETGEVELQGAVADELTPNSNITINYEYKPFIGGGSSSLVGFNNLLTWSDNATFGTTWLYESKNTAAVKPRLGEEPTRAIVGNVNASLNYNPYLLTRIANLLPLVKTDARSSFSLTGEVAMSMPDPNTLGEVYIDDFEGVEDSDLISVSRRSWHPASLPVNPLDHDSTLSADKRMKVFWYNVEPERDGQKTGVSRRDLNPELDERESTLVQTLDIEFDTLSTDPTHWGGVMTGFRGGGLDLTQGQFIEFWVNDFRGDDFASRGGILRIDMGRIDENFYRPGIRGAVGDWFDTEDPNLDGFVALNEDTGLDGVENGQTGDDPEDDWELSRLPEGDPNGRFLRINGTEGNRVFDSEDLDGTGTGESRNSYFSFEVDLASEPVIDVRKSFPTHVRLNEPPHANDSWRLYRIRLSDHIQVGPAGTPSFRQIRHMRIWFEDVANTINPDIKRIQIADFKVVGNRWEKDGIRSLSDSLLTGVDTLGTQISLGVISTKTDPVDYIPPFRPNEVNDIAEKEQSLLVRYDSLQAGQTFQLRKRFVGRGLNFSNYRDAHVFAHTSHHDPDLEYFFKIAIDSLNYYEISAPMTAEYFPGSMWMHVYFNLSDLTQLKLEEGDGTVVTGKMRDLIDNNRVYDIRMYGSPSLFNVRFLYAGVRNRGTQQASGAMWFNDIYLGDRRRDIDYAGRVSGSINLANVVTMSGSFSHTGPDFRGLRQTRGSGATAQSLSLNAKTGLGNFIPLLGFQIPVSGTYSRNLLLPKFTPNSDTEILSDALKYRFRSETVTKGFSSTLTRQGSKNPLLRYTFDKLKVNFSMSESQTRTPSSADTSMAMSGTLDYSITFGQKRVNVFRGVRFRYWLNSFNVRATANRRRGQRWRNVGDALIRDPAFYAATIGTSGQANYNPFQSFTTSFRMNIDRDYARPHEWFGIDIGMETMRNHTFQANYKVPNLWLIGALQPDFNFNATYREDSRPDVRRQGDPPGVRNVSNTRNASAKLNFDVGKYFKRLFGALNLAEEESPPPSRSGGQPQGQPGQAIPDSASVEQPAEEEKGADKWIAVRRIGGVLSRIRRINASFRQRFSSTYSRIEDRPNLLFQLGLTDKSGTSVGGLPLDVPERMSENNSLLLDSGVQVTKNIDVAARYSLTLSRNTFLESEARSKNTVWPDLNLSWTGLEKYGPLKGLFSSSAATIGYRKTTRESGQGKRVDSTDKSRSLTPAIVFTWKNGLNTNLNMNLSKNTSENRGSYNETSSMSINMEFKYAFQPGKTLKIPLPFLRNKTLRSSLNTSLAMGYTRSGGKRSSLGSNILQSVPLRTTVRVSPRVTYNFTRALNGGLFVDFSRSFSAATDQTITTTRVGIDATFTF